MTDRDPVPALLRSEAEVREQTKVFLLPHEVGLMHARFDMFMHEHGKMAELLAEAMSQSSETYHDNAPADAARDEAEIIGWQAQQLAEVARNYVTIPYPRLDDPVIQIGSRVSLSLNGSDSFKLEIVGAHLFGREAYTDPTGDEVDLSTYRSPLGTALLTHTQGDVFVAKLEETREVTIEIHEVEQLQPPELDS